MAELHIPIFPLHSVLLPGGVLPLRIFEPRYLDMVSNCMKNTCNFGVCLIKEGSAAGTAETFYNLGTMATIDYWHMRTDGILGVTAHGNKRFRIISKEMQADKLITALVELVPNEPKQALPAEYSRLATMLQHIINQLGYPFMRLEQQYDDAGWVSARLTELLPIELEQKQTCLEISDPLKRLEHLTMIIKDI
ncbi:MAG: peptidase S16 [Gammaproteobacteria bacterium]|nr:peptidase S16 [Gammaproteobacteria bacterium]